MAYSRRKSPARGRRTTRARPGSGRRTGVRSRRGTAGRGSAGRSNVLRIVIENAGAQSAVARPLTTTDLAGAKVDGGRKGKSKF